MLNIMRNRGTFLLYVSRKKLFMSWESPTTVYTSLEATIRRRNSLSPTGTVANLQLNLTGLGQIYPTVHFFSAVFLYEILLLLPLPQRGGKYIKTILRGVLSSLISP